MKKICSSCKKEKDSSEFGKHKGNKDGLQYSCKICNRTKALNRYYLNRDLIAIKRKDFRKKNPEQARARDRKWDNENKEKRSVWAKKSWKENKEKLSLRHKEWRLKNLTKRNKSHMEWVKNNPDKINYYVALRKAKELQATPKWANKFFIKEIYHLAKLRSKVTGIIWHVDHVIPLKGKLVCGLHVETNLNVIPGIENIRKNNKFIVE